MRNYNSVYHVWNGLTGVITSSGAGAKTLQGNAIDTIGFKDCLAVLCVGSLQASAPVTHSSNLTVKVQEAAAAGTNWDNITDGAIVGTASVYGSATFDVLAVSAQSFPLTAGQYQRKMYIRLNDGTRKRYLRVNASIVGTAACISQYAISVAIILGRPADSNYIVDAINQNSTIQSEWGAIAAMTVPSTA